MERVLTVFLLAFAAATALAQQPINMPRGQAKETSTMKASATSRERSTSLSAPTGAAQATTIDFEKDKTESPPGEFLFGLTGKGRLGVWVVKRDGASPDRGNVLAQIDDDATSYRFPIAVFAGVNARDVDASVKFKPVTGKVDQGAGIVWRYRDQDNYYVVRANALEGNVVLYKVEKGKRTDLPLKEKGRTYGLADKVPARQWGTLRVVVRGNLFEVYHNGKKLYEVEDGTFTEAGKVGLWTKADSVVYFDDLRITVN